MARCRRSKSPSEIITIPESVRPLSCREASITASPNRVSSPARPEQFIPIDRSFLAGLGGCRRRIFCSCRLNLRSRRTVRGRRGLFKSRFEDGLRTGQTGIEGVNPDVVFLLQRRQQGRIGKEGTTPSARLRWDAGDAASRLFHDSGNRIDRDVSTSTATRNSRNVICRIRSWGLMAITTSPAITPSRSPVSATARSGPDRAASRR